MVCEFCHADLDMSGKGFTVKVFAGKAVIFCPVCGAIVPIAIDSNGNVSFVKNKNDVQAESVELTPLQDTVDVKKVIIEGQD